MSWRGRRGGGVWGGPWSGRGPFSYLPPWQRPGWLYGRGACWWLLSPNLRTSTATIAEQATVPPLVPTMPFTPALTKEQEIQMLEQYAENIDTQLSSIKKRLEELKEKEE